MKLSLIAAVVVSFTFVTSSSFAGLTINITQLVGGGIRFEWDGSGSYDNTVGSGVGSTINISNAATGSPFESSFDFVSLGVDFGTLKISLDSVESTGFDSFNFSNSNTTSQDDFNFDPADIGTFSNGGAWEATGFFETDVAKVPFSDFNPGSYQFSTTTGDGKIFETVDLHVTAVPEPSTALPFAALLLGLIARRRRRA